MRIHFRWLLWLLGRAQHERVVAPAAPAKPEPAPKSAVPTSERAKRRYRTDRLCCMCHFLLAGRYAAEGYGLRIDRFPSGGCGITHGAAVVWMYDSGAGQGCREQCYSEGAWEALLDIWFCRAWTAHYRSKIAAP